jgi:hypothetical protein
MVEHDSECSYWPFVAGWIISSPPPPLVGKCRHWNELLDRLWRMLVAFESQLSDIGRTQLTSEVPHFRAGSPKWTELSKVRLVRNDSSCLILLIWGSIAWFGLVRVENGSQRSRRGLA